MTDEAYHDLYLLIDGEQYDLAGKELDENGCTVTALADGTQFGNPEKLQQTLTSLLRDGDLIAAAGYGNRPPAISLEIKGPDLGAIARTEERYQLAIRESGLLVWQPPDLRAEPCGFETLWFNLPFRMDAGWDLREQRHSRIFDLQMSALPFARSLHQHSQVLTLTDRTTVDDGTDVSRWSMYPSGTVTADVDGITVTDWPDSASLVMLGDPGPDFTLSEGQWLGVRWSSEAVVPPGEPGPMDIRVSVAESGGALQALGRGLHADGWTFHGPARRDLQVASVWASRPNGAVVTPYTVHEVAVADGAVTGRQVMGSFVPGGSAPTYGTLEVYAPDGLGEVLLHSGLEIDGFSPALSVRESGSRATSEAVPTSPSGRRWLLGPDEDFAAIIPANEFPPEGASALWLLAYPIAAGSVLYVYSLTTYLDGEEVAGGYYFRGKSVTFTADQVGHEVLIPLDTLPTPPTRVGEAGSIRVAVQTPHVSSVLHDAYLCPKGPGSATTVVHGGDFQRLYIDAPSADDPAGSVWLSNSDRAHAFNARAYLESDEIHTFPADGVRSFMLTKGAAQASVHWYPRNHNHITTPPPEGAS